MFAGLILMPNGFDCWGKELYFLLLCFCFNSVVFLGGAMVDTVL